MLRPPDSQSLYPYPSEAQQAGCKIFFFPGKYLVLSQWFPLQRALLSELCLTCDKPCLLPPMPPTSGPCWPLLAAPSPLVPLIPHSEASSGLHIHTLSQVGPTWNSQSRAAARDRGPWGLGIKPWVSQITQLLTCDAGTFVHAAGSLVRVHAFNCQCLLACVGLQVL